MTCKNSTGMQLYLFLLNLNKSMKCPPLLSLSDKFEKCSDISKINFKSLYN